MARALDNDELRRLEQARAVLRRSALAAMVVAFVVPGVIATALIVMAAVSRGGADEWVGVALSLAAVGAVFTAPMLLGKEGRTLARYNGLRRDTALGLRVVRKVGEVTWGTREHAYVASADGKTLASAFFTQYEAIPRFWDRFDRLRPGRYEFDVLPGSGLVVAAHELGGAPLAPDSFRPYRSAPVAAAAGDPANRALAAAFRNKPADVQANHGGRASLRQRARLLVAHWWIFPAILASGFGSVEGLSTVFGGHPEAALGTLVSIAVLPFALHFLWQITRDLAAGRVDRVQGRLHVGYAAQSGDATGTIHGATFNMNAKEAAALQEGRAYAVYVFHRSRYAVGAEVDDEPDA